MDEINYFSSPSSTNGSFRFEVESEKDNYYNLFVSQLQVLESQNDVIVERLNELIELTTKILGALNTINK